jgi:hypothetical protein
MCCADPLRDGRRQLLDCEEGNVPSLGFSTKLARLSGWQLGGRGRSRLPRPLSLPLEPAHRLAQTQPVRSIEPSTNWYYRPFWVLVLLFFVLGPLGLPFLWRSPRFTRVLKVTLTVAVVVYTGLLVGETLRVVEALWVEMREINLIGS